MKLLAGNKRLRINAVSDVLGGPSGASATKARHGYRGIVNMNLVSSAVEVTSILPP